LLGITCLRSSSPCLPTGQKLPSNGQSPISPAELPIVSPRRRWESRQHCRAGTRALGIDVHIYAENLGYGGNQKDLLHRGAAKQGRHHRSTSPHYQYARTHCPYPLARRGGLPTLSPNAAHGVSPGQAAAIDCRVGFGFALRKLRHSPACSAEMKKRLPPVALSRITIPCSDVRVITTSPTHGSFRTSGEAPIASWVVDELDEVEGGEDDSPLWPRQPVKTQVEKIATTSGKIDFSTAPLPLITGPRILLRG
jgi:hypothetical protein